MNGNLCRETRLEIDQSELRQSLSANTEAHLAACAACRTFRDERLHLRELVGGLKPVTAPADFEMRLRARIARERDVPKQPFIIRFVMSTPAIAVAAVLVIAVGTVVFISQRNQSSTPPPTQAQAGGNERLNPTPTSTVTAREQTVEPEPPKAPVNTGDKPKTTPILVKNSPRSLSPSNGASQAEDFGVRGATNVKQTDRAGEVSLFAPNRPMVVTMYDEHGATRKIQLPPISFGWQRLTDNRKQVSMTNTKDW
jgi:hypothetical protein